MLSYQKAYKLAEAKGIKIYKIINSGTVESRMKNGGHITTRTIDKLCAALGCQPGDLMEYVPDDKTDMPTA